MSNEEHLIFFSYAFPDRDRVLPVFEWLQSHGYQAWIDCRRLLPGQNWDFEIKRKLDKAEIFLFFISKSSYDRRGYLQREVSIALKKLEEKLIDDIYIMPIVLDDGVQIPPQLASIHYVNANEENWKNRLLDALQTQLERLGVSRIEVQEQKKITWSSRTTRESWEGLPGYEVEIELLDLYSDEYPTVVEFGQYVRSQMLLNLFREREVKLSQSPSTCNFGQNKFQRMNTFDATCGDPSIVGKMISIAYSINTYGAGAAHGNYGYQTFSYLLDPGCLIECLSEVFADPDVAWPKVQAIVRNDLYSKLLSEEVSQNADDPLTSWINDGTDEWEKLYAFVFKENGIEILFGAYHVTSFADGPQMATVPYEDIVSILKDEYISALSIEGLRYRHI